MNCSENKKCWDTNEENKIWVFENTVASGADTATEGVESESAIDFAFYNKD